MKVERLSARDGSEQIGLHISIKLQQLIRVTGTATEGRGRMAPAQSLT